MRFRGLFGITILLFFISVFFGLYAEDDSKGDRSL